MSSLLNSALRAVQDLATTERPLIVITGPTGSGKTGLSIDLLTTLQERGVAGEVINADSRQLYRRLDIGTAKITTAEQRGIPHHLLSILDPRERVSIAWYKEAATAAIADCHRRGVIPALVGGSMLYLSAVVDSLNPLPSDPDLRLALQRAYDRDGGAALQAELRSLDPVSADAIDPRNAVYLIRAVEICRLTGLPASEARRSGNCPYDLRLFFLDVPTATLHERIARRTASLLAGGWIDEVEGLRRDGYVRTDPGLVSHGYREILSRLEHGADPEALATDATLQEEINAVTRHYAKRQRTWWRTDERALRLLAQAA